MDKGETSTIFFVFFFADLLEILGERNLETLLIMFVETVVLKSVESDRGLQYIFEVNKTE